MTLLIIWISIAGCESKSEKVGEEEIPRWMEMMEEERVDLAVARKSFDEYWKARKHFKGDRSKKFERWYERQSKRLDRYGHTIPASKVYSEFQNIRSQEFINQEGFWFNYGPVLVGPRNNGDKRDGGRVKHIAFHPVDTSTFYVSCFKSGLLRTTDGGQNWTPLTDHLPQEVFISWILESDPKVIYIGTDAGVLVSRDDGKIWNETGLSSGKTKALYINPKDEQIIVAGNQSGIYRSTDGGNTFLQMVIANKVEEIKAHPTQPNILYAGTNGTVSQYFRSTDGGESWNELTSEFGKGAFIKIAVTPAQPDYVYVINSRDHLGDDSFEGVYRSTDSGLNFSKISGTLPCITGYDSKTGALSRGQPNYNLFIVADPENSNTIYAGGVKSWKSVNGGISWSQSFDNVTSLGFGLHLDQLSWAYSPHDNRLFAVNDGGVYFLNDDHLFQPITDGLPIAEVWECTQSQIHPANVAGGTFHCGVKLNRNGKWYTPWGGDEATCLFDYSDDQYVYHFKYDKISRSIDGGFTFQRINPNPSDRGYYTGTGVLDASDVNTLYVGLFEVERTKNARAINREDITWQKISAFGGNKRIEKIEQSEANHNILYVSREGNNFYRSDDVSEFKPQFIELTQHLPVNGKVTDIATHPTKENIVYILLGSRIFKSVDKGMNWEDMSAGLPAIGLLEMVYDRSSNEGIYIGTDLGVYYKDASMENWIDYSNGLPAIRVSGMDIYYGASREESFLTISTDGRGFWRSLLSGVETITPEVEFTANKREVFTEEEVVFTNLTPTVQVGTYRWEFPGGTPSFSLEKQPSVHYKQPGDYAVSLVYTTANGKANEIKQAYIIVTELPLPIANFELENTRVAAGNYVQFKDISENQPSSWKWTFEGGQPSSSTEKDPVVRYETEGLYAVTLEVTNSSGTDSITIENYVMVVSEEGSGPLQARYQFEDNLEDASSYNRDLFIQGNFVPGFIDPPVNGSMRAYEAPGMSNQFLYAGYKGIGGNNERTVTAWFKTTPIGTRKTIVSWGFNQEGKMWNVMIDQGKIRIEGGACNLQTKKSGLDDNEWHHVAVIYHPSFGSKMKDLKIYIDGVLDENEEDSGASFRSELVDIDTDNSLNDLRIGSTEYNGNYFWRGQIDDVQIYNKALETSEILSIYSIGTTNTANGNGNSIVNVYPNPVLDTLIINTKGNKSGVLRIFDLSGKVFYTQILFPSDQQTSIDLSELSPGIYIVTIENGGIKQSHKISKL
jgi:PKD repeat protein